MSLITAGICLAWSFAVSGSAEAGEVVMSETKSNTLIQVTSGTAQQLSDGLGNIFVGRTNQDLNGPATISIRRGLVEFNPSAAVPAGATITGVTLTVEELSGGTWSETISLSRMLRDWGQGTSFSLLGGGTAATTGDATWYYPFYGSPGTWAAPGGKAGVDYSALTSAATLISGGSAGQSFSWSSSANPALVSDVQRWLDNPASNYGWIMLGDESTGHTAKVFAGSNETSPNSPPQLTAQYIAPWTWTGSGGNNAWTNAGNWTNGSGSPPSGAAIVLGDSHSTNSIVDLVSAAPSISHLTFGANKIMTITDSAVGGGRLTLDNGVNPVAVVVFGSGDTIDDKVAVHLDSDAWITTAGSGDSLTISGDLSDGTGSRGIEKNGAGTLILSGSNTYTGGTTVAAGTLVVDSRAAIADGSNLTIGTEASLFFGASTLAAETVLPQAAPLTGTSAVPEPGTLAIIVFGAAAAVVARRRRAFHEVRLKWNKR
jgi:autotransporter-associated beta strand protein